MFKRKNNRKVAITTTCDATNTERRQREKMKVYNLIILDKSGSMCSIADAAIGGFNETVGSILSTQKLMREDQEHYVSLYVFCGCDKHHIYENVPVEEVKILTHKEYQPCCTTPLFDAMGDSLNRLLLQIQNDRNATAAVTIITDGLENASIEYSGAAIKRLVNNLQRKEGWNFSYIGTNQDVEEIAASISITNTLYFKDDEIGMAQAWKNERKARRNLFARLRDDRAELNESMSMAEEKAFRAERNRSIKNFRNLSEFQDRISPRFIKMLHDNEIFVFGSNLEGHHAGGAAYTALKDFGAVMGQGVGLQGRSYAIPTMHGDVEKIAPYVDEFIRFADAHPEYTFLVTEIGCGIAGFTPEIIAPLFANAINIPNIHLPQRFWKELVIEDID